MSSPENINFCVCLCFFFGEVVFVWQENPTSKKQKNGGVESCSGSWRLVVCHETWNSVPHS